MGREHMRAARRLRRVHAPAGGLMMGGVQVDPARWCSSVTAAASCGELNHCSWLLQARWAAGHRALWQDHSHRHVFQALQGSGSAAPLDAAYLGAQRVGVLGGLCKMDPAWEPDAGDLEQNWAVLCGNERDQALCSDGPRAGKCVWEPPPAAAAIDGATEIPTAPVPTGDIGSYAGLRDPEPFRLRDMGPPPDPNEPMPSKDQTKPTPANIPCEKLPAGESINPNPAQWVTVWERPWPNFPARRRYREQPPALHIANTHWQVDVGAAPFRSRALRLWLAPTSSGRSQVDAVAIVGAQDNRTATQTGPKCKGEVWVSPVRDGTRSSAAEQTATVIPVPCSGRGRCGARGCECAGNFFGEGCQTCRFGWQGPGCDSPVPMGCRDVAFEDLSEFASEQEVKARWRFADYKRFTSRGLPWEHFGSSLQSPVYDLGDHTHVSVEVGTLMIDVPDADDCGVLIRLARDRSAEAAKASQIIYASGCEFFSGLNVVGEERGDKLGFFAVQRRWPHPTASVSVEVWWGGAETGTFLFTILNFVLKSCTWPDAASGAVLK
eukprot:gene9633-42549_t